MDFTCKYCDKTRTESQMAIRGGKVSHMCLDCKQSRTGLASAVPPKKAKRKAAPAAELALSIPAGGFGIEASITDEGYLQLTQENDGSESDNVCLTKREVRELFNTFGEWAIAS